MDVRHLRRGRPRRAARRSHLLRALPRNRPTRRHPALPVEHRVTGRRLPAGPGRDPSARLSQHHPTRLLRRLGGAHRRKGGAGPPADGRTGSPGHPGHRRFGLQRRRAPGVRMPVDRGRAHSDQHRCLGQPGAGRPGRAFPAEECPRPRHRAALRGPVVAQQEPAPVGGDAVALSGVVRPRGPVGAGRPGHHRCLRRGGAGICRRVGAGRRCRPRRTPQPGPTRRLVLGCRRLCLPVRTRGVLHPAPRGDALRPADRGPRRRGGARDVGSGRHPHRCQTTEPGGGGHPPNPGRSVIGRVLGHGGSPAPRCLRREATRARFLEVLGALDARQAVRG